MDDGYGVDMIPGIGLNVLTVSKKIRLKKVRVLKSKFYILLSSFDFLFPIFLRLNIG